MLIGRIGYAAMLVEYISWSTHHPMAIITKSMGEAGIFRLAHNAPMNRHLPMTQIASQVMSDYEISCKSPDFTIIPDKAVSATVNSKVQKATSQENLYASVLYKLLSGWNF